MENFSLSNLNENQNFLFSSNSSQNSSYDHQLNTILPFKPLLDLNRNEFKYLADNKLIDNVTTFDLFTTTNANLYQLCDNFTFSDENGVCLGDEEYLAMIEEYIYPADYEFIFIFLHIIVFIVGLVGNVLVCASVYRNHSMRNVVNYFIVNLAVADFLVILICLPPTVLWDITETWWLGNAMCKIVLYFQGVSIIVSILTLTFISIDRWYAICRPLSFKCTTAKARIVILMIWLFSLVAMIPEAITLHVKPHEIGIRFNKLYFTDCTHNWDNLTLLVYQLLIVSFLFIVPFTLMSIAYYQIARVLWIRTIPGSLTSSRCKTSSGDCVVVQVSKHSHHTNKQTNLNQALTDNLSGKNFAVYLNLKLQKLFYCCRSEKEMQQEKSFSTQSLPIKQEQLKDNSFSKRITNIEMRDYCPNQSSAVLNAKLTSNSSAKLPNKMKVNIPDIRLNTIVNQPDPTNYHSNKSMSNSMFNKQTKHNLGKLSCLAIDFGSHAKQSMSNKLNKMMHSNCEQQNDKSLIEIQLQNKAANLNVLQNVGKRASTPNTTSSSNLSLKKQERQMSLPDTQPNTINRQNSRVNCEGHIRSRRKAAKMLIAVVVMFGFCYLPLHIISILRYTIGLPQNDFMTVLSLISHWLCYMNSAMNPIIYNFMSGKFRNEFKNAFICVCFRKKSKARSNRNPSCKSNRASNKLAKSVNRIASFSNERASVKLSSSIQLERKHVFCEMETCNTINNINSDQDNSNDLSLHAFALNHLNLPSNSGANSDRIEIKLLS